MKYLFLVFKILKSDLEKCGDLEKVLLKNSTLRFNFRNETMIISLGEISPNHMELRIYIHHIKGLENSKFLVFLYDFLTPVMAKVESKLNQRQPAEIIIFKEKKPDLCKLPPVIVALLL
ncbi:hypothetical protein [Thermococcus sp.]|uniref:hypothetical protein n=1 Tax=Thermococcus sp. TaxID=35749 RepID=UPI0026255831|nr:hypothetical protein [Thermococcus sp.]